MGFGIKKRFRLMRTRIAVRSILRSRQEVKLEIGAGSVKGKNGWTTLDLSPQSDLFWDLRDSLPFPDECISIIYSSHVLEHFLYPELCRLLKDCYRVLKPGGIFSVCVPDGRIYINGYLSSNPFDRGRFMAYRPAVISDARMDIVNYIAYMDGQHKHLFDAENLLQVMSRMGIIDVATREYDPFLDRLERKHESIYASGIKPF